MGLASEMKNLSEDILASFKNRIKENEELVIEVQKTIDGFQKDHKDMAAALKAGLDKDEKTRIKEFVPFMKSIKEEISGIFTYTHDLRTKFVKEIQEMQVEVQDLLAKFDKEHLEMATALRAGLDKGEVERLKEFIPFMKNINEEISVIFTYTHDLLAKFVKEIQEMQVEVHDLLAKFDKEHLEMSVELRKDLASGEVERLKEFVPLMKNIKVEISRIFAFTHDLLTKFEKEHQDMAVALRAGLDKDEKTRLKEFVPFMKSIQKDVKELRNAVQVELGEASVAWKKMTDILAQLRKTGVVTSPKEVIKKEVKPTPVAPVAAKVEVAVEAVMEAPVAVEPKVEPKPEVPMTLEEKVLNYINKHPEGIKISEMEELLGETRMRLGFVAKKLLEDGKVQKIDNVYFKVK